MYQRITQATPKILTPTQAAYIAGFMDGEASLMVARRQRSWKPNTRRYYYFRAVVSVAQRDIDVLLYLKELVECGTILQSLPGKYCGKCIQWNAGVIRWLLPQIEPYLILKKRQANLLIAFIDRVDNWTHGRELSDEEYAARAEMYNQSRILNQKPKYKTENRPVFSISTVKSESENLRVN